MLLNTSRNVTGLTRGTPQCETTLRAILNKIFQVSDILINLIARKENISDGVISTKYRIKQLIEQKLFPDKKKKEGQEDNLKLNFDTFLRRGSHNYFIFCEVYNLQILTNFRKCTVRR